MRYCIKPHSGEDLSTLLASGRRVISFLKPNLLDWPTTARQGSALQTSACSCTGTYLVASVVPQRSLRFGVGIQSSETGWGTERQIDTHADSLVAQTSSNNVVGG